MNRCAMCNQEDPDMELGAPGVNFYLHRGLCSWRLMGTVAELNRLRIIRQKKAGGTMPLEGE